MTQPISKADAAREKGVTRGAVTLACRPGHALAGALLPGGRIDRASQAYAAWRRGVTVTMPPPARSDDALAGGPTTAVSRVQTPIKGSRARQNKTRAPTAGGLTSSKEGPRPPSTHVPAPDDFAELEEYAAVMRPMLQKYGTKRGFFDWLNASTKLETLLQKHFANEETQGRLISREMVKVHIFGALDAMARRLLRDAPKTISRRLYGLARSGAGIEEAERVVRDVIGAQLKPVKQNATRVLREA